MGEHALTWRSITGGWPNSEIVLVNPQTITGGQLNQSTLVACRPSKEDEVLIRIRDYKGSGTPWLIPKRLMEGDSCGLMSQKQLFDFVRGGNRDGSRDQMFALANIANEHRFADQPQVESHIAAGNLPEVGRVAIDEFDREAELVCIEIAGTLDVRNEELRLS